MKKIVNNEIVDLTSKEQDELNLEIENFKKEKENLEKTKWKRNRQAEYPSIEDCIHALLDGGDTLTELQEKRQEIKAKYPKS